MQPSFDIKDHKNRDVLRKSNLINTLRQDEQTEQEFLRSSFAANGLKNFSKILKQRLQSLQVHREAIDVTNGN